MPENKNRKKFLQLYSNLPINLRKEVILVTKEGPITWDVAYLEIENKTKLGNEILKKLSELKII